MKQFDRIALLFLSPFLLCCFTATGQVLNFYYGNLHAHSIYSDGNKDSATSHASIPYHDYQFAKTAQHFNFLGISEHNHNGADMVRGSYAKGLQQADSANQDGIFVTMYGMEWGVIGPPGGHTLVYGVNQLIGWDSIGSTPNYDIYNAKLDYAGLFTKIARTPGAFACFAHPATTDYSDLFTNPVNATFDSAIVGSAIRSGPAFSIDTTYNDPSTTSYEARYKDALKRGYHLGATLDHDNHYTTFGKATACRTVVLAPSLSRADIMDGIRKMRTQASDDWNVRVTFTINGKPLGTILSDTVNPQISVTISDPDLEVASNIVITYGIPGSGVNPTTLTSSTTGSLTYTHSIATGASYYYYAVVTQTDGDKIFTAPIWVNKVSALPVKLIEFKATKKKNAIGCSWKTATEWNADYFELERSTNGQDFYAINKQKATNTTSVAEYEWLDETKMVSSLVYYRLKQVDFDGVVHYSNIVFVRNDIKAANSVTIVPNPFENELTFSFDETPEQSIQYTFYNSLGEQVYELTSPATDESVITLPKHIATGLYTVNIQSGELHIAKHLVKQ
ncbi:MAG: T9SS type A sorting domain-containing protein [Bacteroidota bacterium]